MFVAHSPKDQFLTKTANNTLIENFSITSHMRSRLLQQWPIVVWFTGLSGSGKSTLSNLLEIELHGLGHKTYTLDGDNLRNGLCSDLAFSEEDRAENIRRVGEVANLFLDAGIIVMCSFISPFQKDRQMVRELIGDRFVEVFVDCPLDVCESRDTKGLYKKVREGKISNFTGIDSPYDLPTSPEVHLDTSNQAPADSAKQLLDYLLPLIQKSSND